MNWISTGLAALSSAAAWYKPHWDYHVLAVVNWLGGWQVLVYVFIGIGLVRIVMAPYWFCYEIARNFRTEIDRLQSELDRSKEDNAMGLFFKRLADSAKADSLSERANRLAADLIAFSTDYDNARSEFYNQERIIIMSGVPMNDTQSQRKLMEISQNQDQHSANAQGQFHLKYTPRILTIADEFRARGFTNTELDKWTKHPFLAGPHWGIPDIAVWISALSIKLAELEQDNPGG